MEMQNIIPETIKATENLESEVSELDVVSNDVAEDSANLEESSNEVEEDSNKEEIIERPYTLRKLKDKDLFPMLQILKKIGIREFKDAFIQVTSGEKSIKDIGILTAFDIIDILIGNIGKAENEIYALWSDLSGMGIDDMKELEFGTLPLMIADTFSNMKDASFFRVLSKLL